MLYAETMNRPSSSRIRKKCTPAPAKIDSGTRQRKKPTICSRNPLKDINSIGSSSSSSSTAYSSSLSVESHRGCLSFFLSNHSSSVSNCSRVHVHNRPKSTLSKTPKSAPNVRPLKASRSVPSKENLRGPTSQMAHKSKKNSPFLYQWHSGRKRPTYISSQKPKPSPVLGEDSEDLLHKQKKKQHCFVKMRDDVCETPDLGLNVTDCTPVCGSALNFNLDKAMEENLNNTEDPNTPPIEASVSPEMQQCGSSMLALATTPACYGAGHVVSGISDKRKCKPRGILTVGENDLGFDKSDCSDKEGDEYVLSFPDISLVSPVPSPSEASMHWLLYPCNEEDENQKNDSANGLDQSPKLVASVGRLCVPFSPSSCGGSSFGLGNNTPTPTRRSRSNISLVSPSELPEFQGFLGPQTDCVAKRSSLLSPHSTPSCKAIVSQEERERQLSLAGERDPNSTCSLGSENVIQTPQSDSSSDRHFGPSWIDVDDHVRCRFENELDSVAEVLQRTNLSSHSQLLMCDPMGLSFQFTHAATPSNSNSIDLTQFHKTEDYEGSWIPSSGLDNVSQSQMRISWSEGLVSRICEMDEMDICRCLSDEEEDTGDHRNDQFASHPGHKPKVNSEDSQVLVDKFGSPELIDNEPGLSGKCNENFPSHRDCACAESISTDGGSLVASGDSDWNLCYKNQLFEV